MTGKARAHKGGKEHKRQLHFSESDSSQDVSHRSTTSIEDEEQKEGHGVGQETPNEEEGGGRPSRAAATNVEVEVEGEPECDVEDAEERRSPESYVSESLPSDLEDSGTQPHEMALTPQPTLERAVISESLPANFEDSGTEPNEMVLTPQPTLARVILQKPFSVEGVSDAAVVTHGGSLEMASSISGVGRRPIMTSLMSNPSVSQALLSEVSDSRGDAPGAAVVIHGGSLGQQSDGPHSTEDTSGNDGFRSSLARTHYPWLDDYQAWMVGYRKNGINRALFDVSELSLLPVPYGFTRSQYSIDVFFQKRFYSAHKRGKYNPLVRSSPDALAESWDHFVSAMIESRDAWFSRLHSLRDDFRQYNLDAAKMAIHQRSLSENVRCCILQKQQCPMCYRESLPATRATREGMNGKISTDLLGMIRDFNRRWDEQNEESSERDIQEQGSEFDIQDQDFLAQVGQRWFEDRLRTSELAKVCRVCLRLKKRVKLMEKEDTDLRAEIEDIKGSLEEISQILHDASIPSRQRPS